jgi:hypothetical protein
LTTNRGKDRSDRKMGRRRKQLLNDLKEKVRYWKLKEEALNRTVCRFRFGRGLWTVARNTTDRMSD